jgi:modification methylase
VNSPAVLAGLSVWASGQRSETALLREAGALAETTSDRGRIPMGVARAAILAYSRTGDTVADPDAGSGTVLVQALHAGRYVIGLTTEPRWRRVARGNIAAVKRAGAWPDATLLTGDYDAPVFPPRRLSGSIDLVVTGLRHASSDRGHDPEVCLDDATARLAVALVRCTTWLRRSARVIVLARPLRGRNGMLLDTIGAMHVAARSAGLVPDGRCVALTATARGRRIGAHRSRTRGKSPRGAAPVHWDALVLRLPELAIRTSAVALLTPSHRPSRGSDTVTERGGRAA